MRYYIFETQHKVDGAINVMEVVSRSSFAGGLSYYFERASKMVVDENFTSVDILLVDENLKVVPNGHAHVHDGEVDLI